MSNRSLIISTILIVVLFFIQTILKVEIMKEQNTIKINNIENVRLVNQKAKKQKHIATLPLYDGHTVYEWNKFLFQLDKATFEVNNNANVIISGGRAAGKAHKINTQNKKVVIKPNCYYFTALNVANAVKKIENKFNPQFVIVLD